MCTKICLVLFVILLNIIFIRGSRIDTLKQCCGIGNDRASSGLPCTSSTPIKDVEEKYQTMCQNSMNACCKTKNKELQCSLGKEDAKAAKSCDDFEEGPRKDCCGVCKLGLEAKESEDNCADELNLGELFDKTFTACCLEAIVSTTPLTTIKSSTPTTVVTSTTTQPTKSENEGVPKKTTPYKTTLKNMCGISDICAQICIPDGNSFKCDCESGYTLMKDGVSCKPTRIISKQNRCRPNPCAHKCVDTGTSVQCSCYDGYELGVDRISCLDIDECEQGLHTCKRNETCINFDGDYECYDSNDNGGSIGLEDKCPDGYKFNAELNLCDDIDECELEITCPRPQNCVNVPGSYKCEGAATLKCPPGFLLNDFSQSCEDIDECALGADDCNRKSQKCLNTQGNFTCIDNASKVNCPPGFKMDIASDECVDINECEENSELCGKNERCINEPGRYICVTTTQSTADIPTSTIKSVTSSENTITDKATPQKTDTYPTSDNEISSYIPIIVKSTTVSPTYKINNVSTKTTTSQTERPGSTASPITCPRGYRLYSNQCLDINECLDSSTCDSNQDCFNTPGSYVCRCKVGFTKDYLTGACIDVNECQIGTHDCIDGQRCDNTIGSFLCSRTAGCGTGYTLNYQKNLCEDDNECTLNTHNCNDIGPEYACRNTLGSYRCEKAHTMKPNIMQKPETKNTYNFINGQLKKCLPGYKMNSKGDCEDIDECESSPCRKGHKCLNLKGRYQCIPSVHCKMGMELNTAGDGCIDVDECAKGIHSCKSGQICENQIGFHICRCPSGHKMNSRYECEDIDECQLYKGRLCYINAECQNTIGSYVCKCKEGFYKNGQICSDIDECHENNQLCEQICVNVWGGYRCSCSQGYTLHSDNRTCVDINECDKFKDQNLCVGTCENIPGSYACRCPPGYKLGSDGRTCQDIDECAIRGCPNPSDICVNTRGDYKCQSIVCPPNYIRDTEYKSQCKRDANACDPRNISCSQLPDHYSYFFVSFGSNLQITKPIEFLYIRAPQQIVVHASYTLKIVDTRCPQHVHRVTDSHFKLIRNNQGANLAIIRSIEGPQDIELEFEMRMSLMGYLQRIRVTKIFMFVSEYSF